MAVTGAEQRSVTCTASSRRPIPPDPEGPVMPLSSSRELAVSDRSVCECAVTFEIAGTTMIRRIHRPKSITSRKVRLSAACSVRFRLLPQAIRRAENERPGDGPEAWTPRFSRPESPADVDRNPSKQAMAFRIDKILDRASEVHATRGLFRAESISAVQKRLESTSSFESRFMRSCAVDAQSVPGHSRGSPRARSAGDPLRAGLQATSFVVATVRGVN